MLAAGTPSAAEHSITPSSVCRSTVGGTVREGGSRRKVGWRCFPGGRCLKCAGLTQLRAPRFNGDVELQPCSDVVIRDRAVVQAGVLKPHLTPDCQTAAEHLYPCRQEPVVPKQTCTDMQSSPPCLKRQLLKGKSQFESGSACRSVCAVCGLLPQNVCPHPAQVVSVCR